VPPTAPKDLQAFHINGRAVGLYWNPSTDNTGVTGYRVYRNGQKIADQNRNYLDVWGLRGYTTYKFSVEAYDAAGNTSPKADVEIKTLRRHFWWWW
jgi:chitodextrinase